MTEFSKAIDILDKMDFFHGQRAGRELWNDKPRAVQDKDVADFARDVKFLKDFINYQKAEIERLKSMNQLKLDMIHDLRAEIEQWKEEANKYQNLWCEATMEMQTAKAEAYKEFAERLKTEIADALKSNYRAKTEHIEKHYKCLSCDLLAMIRGKIDALRGIDDYIDNLVKEMTGERE